MKQFLAIVVFVFLSSLAGVHQAAACTCIRPSAETAFAKADAVFKGKVARIEKPSAANPETTVTFEVTGYWKGNVRAVTIVRFVNRFPCETFFFSEGETYLVYAFKKDTGLSIRICSRTARLKNAAKDLEALGEPESPPPAK